MSNKAIHDKVFKLSFSELDQAKDLINNYLPFKVLNLLIIDSLKSEKTDFIEEDKKEYFADLLFSVKLKEDNQDAFVYILFEHKSYKEGSIFLQLLGYMTLIWKEHYKNNKTKLPRIIPVVLYHGRKKWHVPHMLSDMFNSIEDLDKYLPDFEAKILNLRSKLDIENIGSHSLRLILWSFKNIFNQKLLTREKLIEIKESFLVLTNDPNQAHQLDICLTYWADKLELSERKIINTICDTLNLEVSKMELISERFRKKGLKQGLEQGLNQGLQQGRLEGIKTLLDVFFSKDGLALMKDIEKINDVKKLKRISDQIRIAKSLDEIKKIIS